MKAIKQYQSASVEAAIDVASPHNITLMLFDGAIKNLHIGKSAHLSNDWQRRSESISKSQAIVTTLAATLNDDAAPELCENLRRLYDFVLSATGEFMLNGEVEKIDSCIKVLKEIKSGWEAIG